WEFIEKLLLAAQRQEGLRQVVLESIDEAHPEAFRRMLRLILDQNLLRFSACVRAVDVWLELNFSTLTPRAVRKVVEQALRFLEDDAARAEALRAGDGQAVYLALWALAFSDAAQAVPVAAGLLKDADVGRRFAALTLLQQLKLTVTRPAFLSALDDADLRVVTTAVEALTDEELCALPPGTKPPDDGLFERVEKLLERLPESPTELEPLVWPWKQLSTGRRLAAEKLTDLL